MTSREEMERVARREIEQRQRMQEDEARRQKQMREQELQRQRQMPELMAQRERFLTLSSSRRWANPQELEQAFRQLELARSETKSYDGMQPHSSAAAPTESKQALLPTVAASLSAQAQAGPVVYGLDEAPEELALAQPAPAGVLVAGPLTALSQPASLESLLVYPTIPEQPFPVGQVGPLELSVDTMARPLVGLVSQSGKSAILVPLPTELLANPAIRGVTVERQAADLEPYNMLQLALEPTQLTVILREPQEHWPTLIALSFHDFLSLKYKVLTAMAFIDKYQATALAPDADWLINTWIDYMIQDNNAFWTKIKDNFTQSFAARRFRFDQMTAVTDFPEGKGPDFMHQIEQKALITRGQPIGQKGKTSSLNNYVVLDQQSRQYADSWDAKFAAMRPEHYQAEMTLSELQYIIGQLQHIEEYDQGSRMMPLVVRLWAVLACSFSFYHFALTPSIIAPVMTVAKSGLVAEYLTHYTAYLMYKEESNIRTKATVDSRHITALSQLELGSIRKVMMLHNIGQYTPPLPYPHYITHFWKKPNNVIASNSSCMRTMAAMRETFHYYSLDVFRGLDVPEVYFSGGYLTFCVQEPPLKVSAIFSRVIYPGKNYAVADDFFFGKGPAAALANDRMLPELNKSIPNVGPTLGPSVSSPAKEFKISPGQPAPLMIEVTPATIQAYFTRLGMTAAHAVAYNSDYVKGLSAEQVANWQRALIRDLLLNNDVDQHRARWFRTRYTSASGPTDIDVPILAAGEEDFLVKLRALQQHIRQQGSKAHPELAAQFAAAEFAPEKWTELAPETEELVATSKPAEASLSLEPETKSPPVSASIEPTIAEEKAPRRRVAFAYSLTLPHGVKIQAFHVRKNLQPTPLAHVFNYHLPPVRMYYDPNPKVDDVFMYGSCLLALWTRWCLDMKYFASTANPVAILTKYIKRGFYTVLNDMEYQVFKHYRRQLLDQAWQELATMPNLPPRSGNIVGYANKYLARHDPGVRPVPARTWAVKRRDNGVTNSANAFLYP